MTHGDAVVDRDGVEFLGDAAGLLDLARDELAEVLEMDVARHELGEGVAARDDRLAEVSVFQAGRAPEAARARHVAAVCGGAGAIGWHGDFRPGWGRPGGKFESRLRPSGRIAQGATGCNENLALARPDKPSAGLPCSRRGLLQGGSSRMPTARVGTLRSTSSEISADRDDDGLRQRACRW